MDSSSLPKSWRTFSIAVHLEEGRCMKMDKATVLERQMSLDGGDDDHLVRSHQTPFVVLLGSSQYTPSDFFKGLCSRSTCYYLFLMSGFKGAYLDAVIVPVTISTVITRFTTFRRDFNSFHVSFSLTTSFSCMNSPSTNRTKKFTRQAAYLGR